VKNKVPIDLSRLRSATSAYMSILNDSVLFLEVFAEANRPWIMFFTWALPYWHSAKYAVDDEWRTDPLVWREFEYLIGKLIATENRKRSERQMPPYVGPNNDEIRELFHGELGLCPGYLRWRKWLP
jgi:hypothetical protein